MGRLDVRIVEARNLPNPQTVGMVDPYVKINLESESHKTSVIEDKTNPTWNEVFKFVVADEQSSQLRFEVMNSNVASDDFLGYYNMSLSGLVRGEVKDEWVLLKQCKTNAELHVRLLAVDFGADPVGGPQIVAEATGTFPPVQAPPQQPCEPMPAPPAMPPVQPVPQQPMPPPQPMPPQPMPPVQQPMPPAPQPQPQPQAPMAPLGGAPAPMPGPPGAPAYGAGAYGAPNVAPAYQTQQQPQWGTPSQPVQGQVVQPNQQANKKGGGLGGLFGKVGGVLSGVAKTAEKGIDIVHGKVNEIAGEVTGGKVGGPAGVSRKALHVNKADGFCFVMMDGALRHIPDANVFAALFPGSMQDHTGMSSFSTAPGAPPVPFPFGKPIPGFAHLKSCNGEFYFIDDNNGQQVRRHINQGAFSKYSFQCGQNLRQTSLPELNAMPQGPPL